MNCENEFCIGSQGEATHRLEIPFHMYRNSLPFVYLIRFDCALCLLVLTSSFLYMAPYPNATVIGSVSPMAPASRCPPLVYISRPRTHMCIIPFVFILFYYLYNCRPTGRCDGAVYNAAADACVYPKCEAAQRCSFVAHTISTHTTHLAVARRDSVVCCSAAVDS